MSYKSRERKRRKQAAQAKALKSSRRPVAAAPGPVGPPTKRQRRQLVEIKRVTGMRMPEHLTWAAAEAIVEASPLFAAERRSARHGGTRDSRSSSSQGAHWLTVLVRAGKCGLCDRGLRAGRDAVYRHKPQELLCVACADKAGLFYRPSLRWERERKRPSQLKLTAPPKPKRSKQPKASGWRAAREWMSDEEWATTREAMGKKAA